MGNYVIHAIEQYSPAPDENVLKSIFSQYERVIIESLISSFGLDFLIEDKYGGDVDINFLINRRIKNTGIVLIIGVIFMIFNFTVINLVAVAGLVGYVYKARPTYED